MQAGIILGPSVLGHIEKFERNVFPENSQFLVQNIGIVGFMFFVFVTGVKMDLGVIGKAGKKHWVVALVGVVVPHIIIWAVALCIRDYMDHELRKLSSIGGVISAVVITTFPVIYSILQDMQLLSSEIGRTALSTVIVSDLLGINIIVAFEAIKQGEHNSINALYYLISVVVLASTVILGIPKVMAWIARQTPEGQPVDQKYIIAILLGVFVMGYMTDFIGAAIGNGPLWLGLAIPDGPPIGSTIVYKTEIVMNHLLMPFSYASVGLKTDAFSMAACWSCLLPLFAMAIMGFVSKMVCVIMAARFVDMPYRDAFILGLMLSLRGQMEFLLYLHWMDLKMVKTPAFSMMVILTVIITSIISPIISLLYDPNRPYMTNKKRTIQHTVQDSEIRIVGCIYDQESMSNLFSFMDILNPSTSCPFTVFALYLVELIGRASPIFIDHSKQDEYWDSTNEIIHNAINHYQEARSDYVSIHFYTSVTPLRTMYQDICELALVNKVAFIILPFHKKCLDDTSVSAGTTTLIRPGVQSTNTNTLAHAPCSVGILACKSALTGPGMIPARVSHRMGRQFAMLFMGGPDAREALSFADRMVAHPDVSLIVIRFLANDYRGDVESERKLDDGVVTWFWVKNEKNDKVVYKEVVVSTGLETISAVQSLNEAMPIDMWIVGRKQGINPIMLEGLSDWSDNPELGVIGDFLVSMDFSTNTSVLVVQQQILRDQRATPWMCLDY